MPPWSLASLVQTVAASRRFSTSWPVVTNLQRLGEGTNASVTSSCLHRPICGVAVRSPSTIRRSRRTRIPNEPRIYALKRKRIVGLHGTRAARRAIADISESTHVYLALNEKRRARVSGLLEPASLNNMIKFSSRQASYSIALTPLTRSTAQDGPVLISVWLMPISDIRNSPWARESSASLKS